MPLNSCGLCRLSPLREFPRRRGGCTSTRPSLLSPQAWTPCRPRARTYSGAVSPLVAAKWLLKISAASGEEHTRSTANKCALAAAAMRPKLYTALALQRYALVSHLPHGGYDTVHQPDGRTRAVTHTSLRTTIWECGSWGGVTAGSEQGWLGPDPRGDPSACGVCGAWLVVPEK